jgi:uncharacterized protein (DUF2336 family)
MDLSFLDKSSAVTPLLVRLYDGHKLYGLAKDQKPIARGELITAVTDLLDMQLSPRESELVADVLIALMRQAELDLREALADKLSILENVPLRLVLQMANDQIEVAGSILKNSPVLGDFDLLYIIKSKGPEYWCKIAARQELNDQVINTLVDTRDVGTAVVLAENKDILLTPHAMNVLSDMAVEHEVIASPLVMRDDITNEIASKIYKYVGEELKKQILRNFDIEQSQVLDAIDEILEEYEEVIDYNSFSPSASVLKSAERFHAKGLLTTKLMLGTLKRGQIQSFVAQFARFTNLSTSTVLEILRQSSGQGLAVVCKAMELAKADFVSIYLLTNTLRGDAKTVDTKDMAKAMQYFERIEKDVAINVMKNTLASKNPQQ